MAAVSLDRVSKHYGAIRAVRELTLTIRDREFFVLLGPTGAGKTTTLRCIAGLEQPESGTSRSPASASTTGARRSATSRSCSSSIRCTRTTRCARTRIPAEVKLRNLPAAGDRGPSSARRGNGADRTPARSPRTDRPSGGRDAARLDRPRHRARAARIPDGRALSNLDAKLRELLRAELRDCSSGSRRRSSSSPTTRSRP